MGKHIVYLVVGMGAMIPFAVIIGLISAFPVLVPAILFGGACWGLGFLIMNWDKIDERESY